MHVTAHTASATSATIVKAQEGTSDQAWSTGDPWSVAACASDFSGLNRVENQRYTANGTSLTTDDEFSTGTLSANWTQVTASGSLTATVGGDLLSCKYSGQSSASGIALVKPITISSGGYVETAMRQISEGQNSFPEGGLCLMSGNTASSTGIFLTAFYLSGVLRTVLLTGSLNSLVYSTGAFYFSAVTPCVFARLTWQAANTWRLLLSPDGVSWSALGFADVSSTLTPTYMGVWVSNWGCGKECITSFEYFRSSA